MVDTTPNHSAHFICYYQSPLSKAFLVGEVFHGRGDPVHEGSAGRDIKAADALVPILFSSFATPPLDTELGHRSAPVEGKHHALRRHALLQQPSHFQEGAPDCVVLVVRLVHGYVQDLGRAWRAIPINTSIRTGTPAIPSLDKAQDADAYTSHVVNRWSIKPIHSFPTIPQDSLDAHDAPLAHNADPNANIYYPSSGIRAQRGHRGQECYSPVATCSCRRVQGRADMYSDPRTWFMSRRT